MANVAKLKKKAAEFELKRQFDKALAVYVEILDDFDQHPEEVDVALFNRVGDMLLRQGNVADAVDYYERAVDRYAEGGFFNNAIALCNKILRQSPGRSSIYYKLGKISAQKGFKNDAKQNFLEYADRMQKSGRMDEAFRALKEFADLCPDQDDIRLMLAEQLSRQDRAGEAIEQLQTLVERYSDEGRDVEARATLDRIMAIDPTYTPRETGPQKSQKSSDIVFLDIYSMGDDAPPAKAPAARPAPPPQPAAPPAPRPPAPTPAPDVGDDVDVTIDLEPTTTIGGLESTGLGDGAAVDTSGSMLDLEPTAFGSGSMDAVPEPSSQGFALDGLEVTSFGSEADSEVASGELDFLIPPSGGTPPDADAPAATDDEATGPELQFFMPDAAPTQPAAAASFDAAAGDDVAGDFTIDLEGFDVAGAPAVEPGTSASVPEVSIDDALSGLPMMDMESSPAPVFDDAPGRGGSELPPFAFEPDIVGGTDEESDAAAAEQPAESAALAFDMDFESAGERAAEPAFEAEVEPVVHREADAAPQREAQPELAAPVAEPAAPEPKPIPKVGRFGMKPKPAPEPAAPEPAAPEPEDRTRRSTIAAEQSVELLEALADSEPGDFGLRRRLAETRLESGDREGGLADLEAAMIGFERAENLSDAASVADEIARITPDSVRIHQKRVEYAFRTNERARLVGAYLDLAGALLGDGQTDKARTVYKRVLDLAPDDIAAQAGLSALAAPIEPP